jgi:hypothetical protein
MLRDTNCEDFAHTQQQSHYHLAYGYQSGALPPGVHLMNQTVLPMPAKYRYRQWGNFHQYPAKSLPLGPQGLIQGSEICQ